MEIKMSPFETLKNKISMMIGRAIVNTINNSKLTATIQVTALNGDIIPDVEYLSPYGFEGMPSKSQTVIVSINGNKDQALAIVLHDRDSRPKDLSLDETKLYSKFGGFVKCNKNGEVEIMGNADYAVAFTDLKTAFDSLKATVDDHITKYNLHKHGGVSTGGGSTAIPDTIAVVSTADMSGAKVDKVRLP
jgi:phage gp45-like